MRRLPTFVAGAYVALGGAQAAQAADLRVFDIPEQPAEQGIAAFALQAGRQILAPGEDIYTLKTRAVHGRFDIQAGLRELLRDTPLTVLSDNGKVIVIVSNKANAASPDATSAIADAAHPETVIVTGFRASLANAAAQKKIAISFTDSIFAEDIGKFPDTNIAESINRIPGILLKRDADGEGVQVAIRGLSTNYTRILLNNAPIMVAGGGIIDSSNSNREVDLNVFPGEFFSEITVTKTARAEILEGGAAGTINLKTRRPFDNPGAHMSYSLQGNSNTLSNGMGGSGAFIASDTFNTNSVLGSVGLLIGIAARRSYQYTNGWEDGNAGWVTPAINNATLCGATSGCDLVGSKVSIGGDAMAIAPTIPSNVALQNLPAGTTVNAAMLKALNPGLDITQISNMLLPRLPRSMYERGSRDRYNAGSSLEIRPSEKLNAYLDIFASRQFRRLDRSDLGLGVRAGAGAQPMIPTASTLYSNGVVRTTTLYNAQFGLEARDYNERFDFLSLNPGIIWRPDDRMMIALQASASRSHYFRETPNVYLVTCPSSGVPGGLPGCAAPIGGVTAHFDNTRTIPSITTNIDLDNPANFQWYGGRAELLLDRRYTSTYGAHLDAAYRNDLLILKLGAAYDVAYRSIVGIDRTDTWQSNICQNGNNSACSGRSLSLIPQAELASYLYPGPSGFVSLDYARFQRASKYEEQKNIGFNNVYGLCVDQPKGFGFSTGTAAGATSGCFEERSTGLYGQVDGNFELARRTLSYNLGLRWSQTRQEIRSPTKLTNGDYTFPNTVRTYQAYLPSMNLVYELDKNAMVRASWSRTMTRANVAQMIQTVNFSDFTAQSLTLGNPRLTPYFSNNIDIGVETYTGLEGYFSLALFRKDISGFSVAQIVSRPFSYLSQFGITWSSLTSLQQSALAARAGCTSDDDCAAVVNVTQQINAPGIETIKGLEITYVQPLDGVLSSLSGFGFTGNATVTGQSSSGSAAVHATDVAPYSLNLTGYYERNGLMARLSYTFRARSYGTSSNVNSVCLPTTQAAASGCPEGAYLFSAAYGQADFSSSLRLSRFLGEIPSDPEITFNVQNLFHAKQFSYFQYSNATSRYYRTGQTISFGLHGAF
ncbi:TonB-dependent receptor [Rhizomicrobium palustre]|uniref:TonB-dependent receptor n=1 Tax=Rhizomicrobium palustre TaxID=189966 RepID=A0A846N0P6_9PROT|nr:TonB-dependent receptor [Rhizomicrobium palustre]NIK89524.1 TonB-dependent receptor [Rhizomicrobium palustre]